MKFSVYQINLRELGDEINRLGSWDAAMKKYSKVKAYLDVGSEKNYATHLSDGHYDLVSVIEAEDLDEVFHIGNMGPEEKITRLAPMHSVSVGDLIANEKGEFFAVEGIGFLKLGE